MSRMLIFTMTFSSPRLPSTGEARKEQRKARDSIGRQQPHRSTPLNRNEQRKFRLVYDIHNMVLFVETTTRSRTRKVFILHFISLLCSKLIKFYELKSEIQIIRLFSPSLYDNKARFGVNALIASTFYARAFEDAFYDFFLLPHIIIIFLCFNSRVDVLIRASSHYSAFHLPPPETCYRFPL